MSNSKKKKMPKGSMETFFKVLRMIGNYRFLLILSIVLAAFTVVLQLYVPILFGNAIDEVVGAHAVDFDRMWYYLSRILVMVIVSSVSTWVMSIINNRMTYRTVQDIRAKAIRHIQELPLSYLDQHSTGRYRYPLRRSSSWLHPAVFRYRDHRRNPDLHVFQKRLDHPPGYRPDTVKLFRGQIHLQPLLPDVPEAE